MKKGPARFPARAQNHRYCGGMAKNSGANASLKIELWISGTKKAPDPTAPSEQGRTSGALVTFGTLWQFAACKLTYFSLVILHHMRLNCKHIQAGHQCALYRNIAPDTALILWQKSSVTISVAYRNYHFQWRGWLVCASPMVF